MTRRATLRSRFAVLRAGARQLIAMIDPSDSRLERRAYRDLIGRVELPAPTTPYHVERDVAVTMPDGAVLLTDVWLPAQGRSGAPAVLVRTPYGRFGVGATARVLAERGIFVVVQSCRGTFGSAGTFDPFTAEDRDGAAAVRWIEAQPWYPGRLATAGASYVGHTQWAITAAAPDSVALQVITVSARSFHSVFRPGGGFALGTMLAWVMALDRQEAPRPLIAWWLLTAARRRIEAAAATIPLSGAACAATGHDVGAFNRWVAGRGPGDRWWGGADSGIDVEQTPPIVLVAGWHDLFLSGQLDDHRDLVAAGRPVRLVIGAWTHMDPGPGDRALLELAGELGITDSTPPAVDVEIMPDGEWVALTHWPPPAEPRRLRLGTELRLDGDAHAAAATAAHVSYHYDPAAPTPTLGGRSLNPFDVGVMEQTDRERRADVVTFTGAPLPDALTAIGEPVARLRFSSDGARPDLFVRLCDVDEQGRSTTVTDGYVRLPPAPPGTPRDVELRLAATAYRWHRRHRLRLQVSSGAHPLYARNPGTDDPIRDFGVLRATTQRIDLGDDAPATLELPVA